MIEFQSCEWALGGNVVGLSVVSAQTCVWADGGNVPGLLLRLLQSTACTRPVHAVPFQNSQAVVVVLKPSIPTRESAEAGRVAVVQERMRLPTQVRTSVMLAAEIEVTLAPTATLASTRS
uniref:Uncharacterized protein n=1 Tax=Streptomyces phage Kamino TaxID=3158857 RepID=A0AAU7GZE4_9CAUD